METCYAGYNRLPLGRILFIRKPQEWLCGLENVRVSTDIRMSIEWAKFQL